MEALCAWNGISSFGFTDMVLCRCAYFFAGHRAPIARNENCSGRLAKGDACSDGAESASRACTNVPGRPYKRNSELATVHLALKKIPVLGLNEPVCAFGFVWPYFPSVCAVLPIHVLVRVMRAFGLSHCGSGDLAFLLFSFRPERVTLG